MSKRKFTCQDGTEIKVGSILGISPLAVSKEKCEYSLYISGLSYPVVISSNVKKIDIAVIKLFKDSIMIVLKSVIEEPIVFRYNSDSSIMDFWINTVSNICSKYKIDILSIS